MITSPTIIPDSFDSQIAVLCNSSVHYTCFYVYLFLCDWLQIGKKVVLVLWGILQQIDNLVLCINFSACVDYDRVNMRGTANSRALQRCSTRQNCYTKMCTGLSSCLNQTLWHKVCLIPLFSLLDQTENILISMAIWDWIDATEARTWFHIFKIPRRYWCRLGYRQQSWKHMPQSHAGRCAITTSLALVPELALLSFWVADTARCRHCLLPNTVRSESVTWIYPHHVNCQRESTSTFTAPGCRQPGSLCTHSPRSLTSSICSTLHTGTQISYLSQFRGTEAQLSSPIVIQKADVFSVWNDAPCPCERGDKRGLPRTARLVAHGWHLLTRLCAQPCHSGSLHGTNHNVHGVSLNLLATF